MINRNRNLLSLVIVIVSVLCIGSSVFAGSYTKSFTYAFKNVDPIWFSDKSYGVTEILSVKNTSAGTVERTLTCNLTVTDQSNDHKEYSNQTVTFGANQTQKLTSKAYNGYGSITTKHYYDVTDGQYSTGGSVTYYGAANTGTCTMNVG